MVKKKKEDLRFYDMDIRKEFVKRNLKFFTEDNTYTINEMKLNSKNIIDLIHFNFNKNLITGIEFKSERDSIKRLEGQLNTYITFCNLTYVICHEKHDKKVSELVESKPYYNNVGIILVDDRLNFKEVRRSKYTKPYFDSFIRNLDTEELTMLCEDKGLSKSGTKRVLINNLKLYTTFDEIYRLLKHKVLKYYITGETCSLCKVEISYNKSVGVVKDKYCLLCNKLIS